MSTPLLSIIIPCYNAAQTIADTLRCFELEFNDIPDLEYEIIVVNDGSIDETTNVVTSSLTPHIKYFEKQNTGVSDTRNYGLKNAHGEYVWFFDADDQLFSGAGKHMLSILKRTNADVLNFSSETQDYTNTTWISKLNNCATYKILFEGKYQDFLKDNITGFSCWSLIIRRQLLIEHKIFFDRNLPICEDVWWNISLANKLSEVLFVKTDLNVVRYIVNQNSTVNTINPARCKGQLIATCEFYDKLHNISLKSDYMELSLRFWRAKAVNQSITRFLSSSLDKSDITKFIAKILDMINETNASGKVVLTFKLISRHYILVLISQTLYQSIFLRYIKPRIGRN